MSIDFQAPPWWKNGPDDYTINRSAGVDYTMDDLIGRADAKKYTLTTDDPATVSGTEGTILI
ncbi:hypothetical protein KAW18_03570 [candidate division WOR-3 bacterium]|nr:hypothetical protein [candidate division WOR-3 bacterium]